MGRGQGPPAYLAPLPHDAPKTKVHWESPQFLFLSLQGTNTHKALDSLPVLHFAVHLLPSSANNMSFKLQDGCLLNELTLCVFDNGYWWSTSLRLTWHKGAFCLWFFSVSSLCSSCCPLFPAFHISFPGKKKYPLRAGFSIQHLFIPFATQFLYFQKHLSLVPAPTLYPRSSLRAPALPVLQQI